MTHRTQGNSYLLLPVYDIIKDMIKNREEQSGEDMYRAKSGGALSARAPVPWSWGTPLSQYVDVFTNLAVPQIWYYWDFYVCLIT